MSGSLSSGTLNLRFMQRATQTKQDAPDSATSQNQSFQASSAGQDPSSPNRGLSKSDADTESIAYGNQQILVEKSYINLPLTTSSSSSQPLRKGFVSGRRSFGNFNKDIENSTSKGKESENSNKKQQQQSSSHSKKSAPKAISGHSSASEASSSSESSNESGSKPDLNSSEDEDDIVARSLKPKSNSLPPRNRPRPSLSEKDPKRLKKDNSSSKSKSGKTSGGFMKPAGFEESQSYSKNDSNPSLTEQAPAKQKERKKYQPDEQYADEMIQNAKSRRRQKRQEMSKGSPSKTSNTTSHQRDSNKSSSKVDSSALDLSSLSNPLPKPTKTAEPSPRGTNEKNRKNKKNKKASS